MSEKGISAKDVRLSEVTELIQYGYTAQSSPSKTGPKYLRITDIQNDQVDWTQVPRVSIERKEQPRYALQAGDIVFARTGATVGKSFLIRSSPPNDAVFASYLIRVRCKQDLLAPEYAAFFFKSEEYWRQIREGAAGTGQPNFNGTKLGNLSVPLWPLKQQRCLVAQLDNLSARSKNAREELAHVPRLVQRYRGAVLAAAFSGELTKEWRLETGTVAESTWRQTTLEAVSADVRYGTATKCHYEPKKTPVLRIPNVVSGRIDLNDLKYGSFSKEEHDKLELKAGDLLVIRSNGSLDLVGRAALVPKTVAGYLYAGYLIRIRLDLKQVYPLFVLYAFEEPSIRQHIEGLAKSTSGVKNINSEQLRAIPLKLPPLEEQKEIIEKIHSAFSHIDHLRDEAGRAHQLLDRLDQSTLAKAFRGEFS